jgi:hypothetical protein
VDPRGSAYCFNNEDNCVVFSTRTLCR